MQRYPFYILLDIIPDIYTRYPPILSIMPTFVEKSFIDKYSNFSMGRFSHINLAEKIINVFKLFICLCIFKSTISPINICVKSYVNKTPSHSSVKLECLFRKQLMGGKLLRLILCWFSLHNGECFF